MRGCEVPPGETPHQNCSAPIFVHSAVIWQELRACCVQIVTRGAFKLNRVGLLNFGVEFAADRALMIRAANRSAGIAKERAAACSAVSFRRGR